MSTEHLFWLSGAAREAIAPHFPHGRPGKPRVDDRPHRRIWHGIFERMAAAGPVPRLRPDLGEPRRHHHGHPDPGRARTPRETAGRQGICADKSRSWLKKRGIRALTPSNATHALPTRPRRLPAPKRYRTEVRKAQELAAHRNTIRPPRPERPRRPGPRIDRHRMGLNEDPTWFRTSFS